MKMSFRVSTLIAVFLGLLLIGANRFNGNVSARHQASQECSDPSVYDFCEGSGEEWPSCLQQTNGGEVKHGVYHVVYQNPDTGFTYIKRPIL